jgi:hypothetical protein
LEPLFLCLDPLFFCFFLGVSLGPSSSSLTLQ